MDWDAIAATAELLGAAGVIVSLIYLAIHVRIYSADTRHASIDRLVEIWSTSIGALADNRDLALVWANGHRDLSALDATDKAMFFAHSARILRVSEAIYFHYRDGTMDESLWEGIDACLTDVLGVPAMGEYWEIRGH